jgi:glycosyltransferase involved in cell wall biosynthesis
MVRVLLINYEYPPLGGGTAIAGYYLLEEFKKLPVKVNLLTSKLTKNKNLHHQSYWDLINFFLKSTVWTFKHRNDYHLIHAFSGLPGSITAFISGKPFIVSFRGADEPGYEPRHEILWKLIKPLMGRIYRRARSLDANSQYLKKLVLKSWPDLKIKVISNGVDTKEFYPAKKPVRRPIILSTSRFGQRKGVEYLIKAMTLVPEAELWLAGSGVLEKRLKRLAKRLKLARRIKFLGPVGHHQLPALYRRARLFVLPSLSESQSNSLLEALACGLPVVATNIGGNAELVNSGNGALVPVADSQSLAKAINQVINQTYSKTLLSKKFPWEKSAKKYFQIYSQQFFSGRDTA